ncbi:MAG: hypothetical protein H6Q90_5395 [Deltaproteobacteria bacterium]|nr:hypothetical protein [Deltaproteobacteria bacterium]
MRLPLLITIADTAASIGKGNTYVASVGRSVRFWNRCVTTTSMTGPRTVASSLLSSIGSAGPALGYSPMRFGSSLARTLPDHRAMTQAIARLGRTIPWGRYTSRRRSRSTNAGVIANPATQLH